MGAFQNYARRPKPPYREKGRCRWCNAPVPRGRRSWCSQKCVDEYGATHPQEIRRLVLLRDGGACALCGRACEAIRRKIYDRLCRNDIGALRLRRLLQRFRLPLATWFDVRSLWEADHIQPVVEGGSHDLTNIRTLCVLCHKQETAKLHARLRAARAG